MKPIDYYNTKKNNGGYQYVLLSKIIDDFIYETMDDDSILKNTKRVKIIKHAKDALLELNKSTLNQEKVMEITVPENLSITMPHDYVALKKISVVVEDKVTSSLRLMPLNRNAKINIAPRSLQGNTGELLFDAAGNVLTTDVSNAYNKPFKKYEYIEGNSQFVAFGEFTIDKNRGKILFSSDLYNNEIVLQYRTDGLQFDTYGEDEIRVHKDMVTVLKDLMFYSLIRYKRNIPQNRIQSALLRFKTTRHEAKLNNLELNLVEVFKKKSSGNSNINSDTQNPEVPVLSTSVNSYIITGSWNTPSDNIGVTSYEYEYSLASDINFLNSTVLNITANSHAVTLPNGTYIFRLRARDVFGNFSNYSTTSTATVFVDIIAPTNPTLLTATVSNYLATLNWNPSTDDGTLDGYEVYYTLTSDSNWNNQTLISSSGTTQQITLVNGDYKFRVRAKDAANNFSGYSNTVTATIEVFFEFQVNTSNAGTSNSNQFSLPLTSAFTDNITVYWGDNSTSTITSYNQTEVTHTYTAAGTYTIRILGAITAGWIFNNGGDRLKMGDITTWGEFSCTANHTFYGCSNMTSIGSDVDFLNQATNLGAYFYNCGLTSLPSTLTLANLTNGYSMFRNNSLTSLPSGMALANLLIGSNMFGGNSLTSLSAVMTLASLTDGSYMFKDNSLTVLPSGMTLANMTNGEQMFSENSLTALPSGMTLANVTNGMYMFNRNSLAALPTLMTLANLINGFGMFYVNSLTALPSGMTLANVTNGMYMFNRNSLAALPTGMTLANLTDGYDMFSVNSLTALPSGMTLANVTNGMYMFFGNSLTALPTGMTLANLTDGSDMFYGNSLAALPSGMTLANLTDGEQMFRYNSLTALPSGMTLASLTDGGYMFYGNSLTALPTGMTLANLTDGFGMFYDNSLTALPSGMTLANMTNGGYMFRSNSLTDLPSGITFSNLYNGINIFLGSTINTTRYSQLLIDIENLNSYNNFSFHGGNSQYNTSGQTARNILTALPRNLTITDGGLV